MTAPKVAAHTPGFRVMADVRGQRMQLGVVCMRGTRGWQFVPYYQARESRKMWETPEAALKGRVKNYELVPL